jgi:hypothetical protein
MEYILANCQTKLSSLNLLYLQIETWKQSELFEPLPNIPRQHGYILNSWSIHISSIQVRCAAKQCFSYCKLAAVQSFICKSCTAFQPQSERETKVDVKGKWCKRKVNTQGKWAYHEIVEQPMPFGRDGSAVS